MILPPLQAASGSPLIINADNDGEVGTTALQSAVDAGVAFSVKHTGDPAQKGVGIWGESVAPTGVGVYGRASSLSGSNTGVMGKSYSPDGIGVQGQGPTFGIYGYAYSSNGIGVHGYGESSGVSGESGSLQGTGVAGFASGASGRGVYGESVAVGVYGESDTKWSGIGVIGNAPNGGTGVIGQGGIGIVGAAGPEGIGAFCTASSGGAGVYASGGVGVHAIGTHEFAGAAIFATTTTGSTANIQEWRSGLSDSLVAVVDAHGWLGLGTSTSGPQRSVHLQGSNAVFRMDRDVNSSAFVLTRAAAGDFSTVWKTFYVGVDASGSDNGYFFIGDRHTGVSGPSDVRLVIDNDGNILPPADNTGSIGISGQSWASIKGHVMNPGDLVFDNGIRATEDGSGLAFKNDAGEKIAVLDAEGNLYVKGELRKLSMH